MSSLKVKFKGNLKRITSGLLAIIMIVTLLPASAFAADVQPLTTPSVQIVSFNRGAQEDLRSSELLEARVTGYDGNVQDLVYKWTNNLGTYLYVYNSHNMYGINNTDGEVEIGEDDVFQGQGFAWAAIYGANLGNDDLVGTVKVEVYEKVGNSYNKLCEDTHTGSREFNWSSWSYIYSGFIYPSLQDDIEKVSFGIFEGDTRQLKDLLGESSILHITCTASSTSAVQIASGGQYISLTTITNGYEIKGIQPGTNNTETGDARLTYTISKGNCKFHQNTSATATTTVYVYKKPTATVSTTYITVANLDDRCTYTIDGKAGVPIYDENNPSKIVAYRFDGLTPNTKYQIVAEGKAGADEDNTAYAYIYATTLPVYTGKVRVMLNGSYDSSTHDALSGTPTDIEVVVAGLSENASLYLKKTDGTGGYIELPRTTEGEYSAALDNGEYNIYVKKGSTYELADHQVIVMNDDSRTRYLFYYSVTYTDDSDIKLANKDIEYYHNGHEVDLWFDRGSMPTKDGYMFLGWQDQSGKSYLLPEYGGRETRLTNSISQEYRLRPLWSKNVNVYVDIELDHINGDDHNNSTENMKDISFALMQRKAAFGEYTRMGGMTINDWDFSLENTTYDSEYFVGKRIYQKNGDKFTEDVTKYFAKSPEAKRTGLIAETAVVKPTFVTSEIYGGYYNLEINKANYSIVDEDGDPTNGYSGITVTISPTTGDVYIKAQLEYVPNEFDLAYSVKIIEEDEALFETLPDNLKPIAANVKITSYYNTPYDMQDRVDWYTITQHAEVYERVDINKVDNDYIGTGHYSVAMNDGTKPYYYRMEIVSYVLADGTRIHAIDKENGHTIYESVGGRYVATLPAEIPEGQKPSANTTLEGAYYDSTKSKQVGTLQAEIDIVTHDITFDANGGTFKDGTTADKTVKNQIVVPDLSQFAVTKTTPEGEWAFDGWYVVDGETITDEKVNTGDDLVKSVTVKAKWIAPVNLQGNVYIAGFYGTGEDKINIYEHDRVKTVKVQLQEIKDNGYPITITSQDVSLSYGDDEYGKGSYSFNGVINDGRRYRVLLNAANYAGYYQNEPESITAPSNYALYSNNESDYIAIFESSADKTDADKNTAVINIYGNFEPTSFNLFYKIDATEIANGYRPKRAETLVLCYENTANYNYPQRWATISQMQEGDSFIGQDTTHVFTANGAETQYYSVWNNSTDGKSLYEYAIRIDKYIPYNSDTKEVYSVNGTPFTIIYNTGAARFDPVATAEPYQTQLLTATLKPNRYGITYQLDAGDDVVTAMDTYPHEYYWSYGATLPTGKPQREGYTFLGWKEVNTKGTADTSDDVLIDGYVKEIAPTRHEDITLRAIWKANEYTYTIRYFYENVENKELLVTGKAAYGSRIELTADDIADKANGFELDGVRYSDDTSDSTKYVIVIGTTEANNLLEVHYIKQFDIPYTVKYYREKTDGTYEELTEFEHQHHNGITNSLATAHVKTYGEEYEGAKGIALKGYVINSEKSTSYTENGTKHNYTILIDGENTENNIINLYYDIAQYNYSVQYYYGDVLDESKTVTGLKADYGTLVNTYENKTKDGYQSTPYRVQGISIGTDPSLNIVKVYYGPRTDIDYVINYYAENNEGGYHAVHTISGKGTFGQKLSVTPLTNGADYTDNTLKASLTGYVLDHTNPSLTDNAASLILGTDTSKNVINIYYRRGDFGYKVEFYKEGQSIPFETLDKGEQKLGTAISASKEDVVSKTPVGYKHKETTGATVISANISQNIIKVYYTPQTDLPYWVEYYREKSDGTYELAYTDKDVSNKGTYGQIISVTPRLLGAYYSGDLGKALTGYIYTTTAETVESAMLDITDKNGNPTTILKLFYERNNYAWSVEYYKQDEAAPFYIDAKGNAPFASQAEVTSNEIASHKPVGYKGGTAEPAQLTISTNPAANVIRVTYEKDENQTKELTYTVQHDYSGVIDADKTKEYTISVWINDSDEMDIVDSSLNQITKFGYRYSNISCTNGENTNDNKVVSGTVITLHYEDIRTTYTVEHYKENPESPNEYERVDADVQVINCVKGEIVTATPKTKADYPGYVFDDTIPGTIVSGTVPESGILILKLYYKKDDTQTKPVSYKVQHKYENSSSSESRILYEETYTKDVWLNAADSITIAEGTLEPTVYDGYVFCDIAPLGINEGDVVASGSTIVLRYEEDTSDTAKKDVFYIVKYYLDGVEQTSAKETYTDRVWKHSPDQIEITALEQKTFTGYKYSHTSPAYAVGDTVLSGQEIGMYYVFNPDDKHIIQYTVKHTIEGNITPEHTYVYPKNVHSTITELEVTEASLVPNTYLGYECTSITLENSSQSITAGDTVDDNAVIIMNYTRDNKQTKPVSYTVKHMHGTTQLNTTDIVVSDTVWVNDPAELTVTAESIATPVYEGYTYHATEPTDLIAGTTKVANGTVIVINYVKDESKTKTLKYTVKHVTWNGKTVGSGTKTEQAVNTYITEVWMHDPQTEITVKSANYAQRTYTGYKYANTTITNSEDVTDGKVIDGTEITLHYVKNPDAIKEVFYTVKYFKEGVEDKDAQITRKYTVWINDNSLLKVASEDINTTKYGDAYKLASISPDVRNEGSTVADKTVITLYFETDTAVTENVTYTVKHVTKDGENTVEKAVEEHTVTVPKAKKDEPFAIIDGTLAFNFYTGYSKDGVITGTEGYNGVNKTVTNGTVITITYNKDDTQTKKLSYIVRHKIGDNVIDQYTKEATVWVNASNTIAVDAEHVADQTSIANPKNAYVGYKLAHYQVGGSSVAKPTTVTSGTVVTVTYIVDTDHLSTNVYTVKHIVYNSETVDGAAVKQEMFVDNFYETIPTALDKQKLTVKQGSLDQNDYLGYKYAETVTEGGASVDEGDIVTTGTVILVKYVKDLTDTKELSYTVKHLLGGVERIEDTKTYKQDVWVHADNTLIVQRGSVAPNNYLDTLGYEYAGIDPAGITNGSVVENGLVIELNYIKDLTKTKEIKYTVKHVYMEDSTPVDLIAPQEYKTVVHISEPDTIPVQEGSLDWKFFAGYSNGTKSFAGNFTGSETVLTKDATVTLIYTKDENLTKPVYITVKHNVGGIIRYTQEYSRNVWAGGPDQITVEDLFLTQIPYEDYRFDHYDPENVQAGDKLSSGTTITLHYVTTKANYKVEHYLWDDETKNYGSLPAAEESFSATIGTTVTATAKTTGAFEGYMVNPYAGCVTTGQVVADGTLVLKLYYDLDIMGGDIEGDQLFNDPDNVPDKYQATIIYNANPTDKAQSISRSKEVITIYDSADSTKWAYTGNVTTRGTMVTPIDGYKLRKWTYEGADVTNATENMLAPQTIAVAGGGTYIFTAQIVPKPSVVIPKMAAYKVEYYKWDTSADDYVLQSGDTQILMGSLGETAVVNINAVKDKYAAIDNHSDNYILNLQHSVTSGIVRMPAKIDNQINVLTLKLYFDIDNIGSGEDLDEPDTIPDKYQATILYIADPAEEGILSRTKEIVTITGASGWLQAGVVNVKGAKVTPTENYKIDKWTFTDNGTETDVAGAIDNTLAQQTIAVAGGKTYTYCANLVKKPANYKVVHYKWNDTLGIYQEADSSIIASTVGETVTATVNNYPGYVYNSQTSTASGVVSLPITGSGNDYHLVLILYYDVDKIGGGTNFDQADTIPDKYQVTVLYMANPADKAQSISLEKEVITIFDKTDPTKWAETGNVNISGTIVVPDAKYKLNKWTFVDNGTETDVENAVDNTLETQTISVTGGSTYTYCAQLIKTVANYKVEHYKWNSESGSYELEETENFADIAVDTAVTATAKTYTGFVLNPQATGYRDTGNVAIDDSLVLKLYYDADANEDNVPDIYQVLIIYQANPQGVATLAKTSELLSIRPTLVQKLLRLNTGWLTSGSVTVDGTEFTMVDGYLFTGWTDKDGNSVTFPEVLKNVTAGETYVFTANFEEIILPPEETDDIPTTDDTMPSDQKAIIPATGDTTNTTLWIILLVYSEVIIAAVMLVAKRRKAKRNF